MSVLMSGTLKSLLKESGSFRSLINGLAVCAVSFDQL